MYMLESTYDVAYSKLSDFQKLVRVLEVLEGLELIVLSRQYQKKTTEGYEERIAKLHSEVKRLRSVLPSDYVTRVLQSYEYIAPEEA